MKNWIFCAVALTTALCMTACLPLEETPGKTVYDVEAILKDPKLTPTEKSEKLALIGEAIFTPSGFMLANEVFILALEQDAKNQRASLYKKIAAPMMELKGVVNRVDALSRKFSPEVRSELQVVKGAVSINPVVRDFFMTGQSDIQSEDQAQVLVDKIRTAQNSLRLHLRGMKHVHLRLYPNAIVGELVDIWRECPVSGLEKAGTYHRKYEITHCPYVQKTRVDMDSSDAVALSHIVAGLQVALGMATGYDARGVADYDRFTKSTPGATGQERLAFAQRSEDFGRLRNAKALNFVRTMGSDFYSGLRWAREYQDQLCPKTWNKSPRPGMIFSNGLCVRDYPDKAQKEDAVFHIVAASLAGGTVAITVADRNARISEWSESGSGYQTQANFFAPFLSPVKDLKTQLPTRFSPCGMPENAGDPTLAGILPKGDALEVATKLGLTGKPCP